MIPFRKILFARRAGRLANDLCVDQPAVLVLAQQDPAEIGPADGGDFTGSGILESDQSLELGIAVPVELLLQPLPMNLLDQLQHVEVSPALPPIPRPWRC